MTIFAQDTDTRVQAQASAISQGGGVSPYPGALQLVDETRIDLEDLQDVTITNVNTGDIIKWNGSAWVNDTDLGHSLVVQEEGTNLEGSATVLNFTGDGVEASGTTNVKTIHITRASLDAITAEDVEAGNATITGQEIVRAEPGAAANFLPGTLLPAVASHDGDTIHIGNVGTDYDLEGYDGGYFNTHNNTIFLADADFSQSSIETFTVDNTAPQAGAGFFNNRSFIDLNESTTNSVIGKFLWVTQGNATSISGVGVAIDSDGAILIGNANDEHIYFTQRDGLVISGTVIDSDNVRDGSLNVSKLSATGTRSSSTYLRGDNTWATVSGGTGGGTPSREGYGIDITADGDTDVFSVDTDVIATRDYAATVGPAAPGTNISVTTTTNSLSINSSTGTNASIPAATTSFWGAMTDEDKTKLDGIATGAEVNVQSDWNATSGDALINNKPFNTVGDGLEVSSNALQVDLDGTTLSRGSNGISVSANAIGANELNVTGNGTNGQYLRSDGDGSMTWASVSGGGASNLRAGTGITIVDSEINLDTDAVNRANLGSDLTAPNLGLSQESDGALRLSPAFVDAAGVLANEMSYSITASANDITGNNGAGVDGNMVLSTFASATGGTANQYIAADNPSSWKDVRSIVIARQDNHTPSRSIAGLIAQLQRGSLVEIRNSSNTRFATWGLTNITYVGGASNTNNAIVINVDTEVNDSGVTNGYNNDIYEGLWLSLSSPDTTDNTTYTVVVHGADRVKDGSYLLPGSVRTRVLADDAVTSAKLTDNAVTNAKIADNAVDTTQIANFAIENNKISDDAVTYRKINIAGTSGQRLTVNASGSDWVWETDHSGTVYSNDYTAASATPTQAGQIRFLEQDGTSLSYNAEGDGLNLIRSIEIFGRTTIEQQALTTLQTGARIHVTTGTGDNDHFAGQLSGNATTSAGVTTLNFSEAVDRELAPSAGRINTSSNAISVRFSTDDAGVVFAEDIVPNAITESKIADGAIFERHLESSNTPADNQLLSYDADSGGFTWITSTGGGTTYTAGDGLQLNGTTFSVDPDIATDSDIDALKHTIGVVRTEINDSVARFGYVADSDFVAKRDFTDLDTTDTELIISTLSKDSETWSNLAAAVNSQWDQTGDSDNPGALNFHFRFYREAQAATLGTPMPIWPVPTDAISAGICTHATSQTIGSNQWASSTNGIDGTNSTSLPSAWTGITSFRVTGSLTDIEETRLSSWINDDTDNYVVFRDSSGNNWAIFAAVSPDSFQLSGITLRFTNGKLINSAGTPQANMTIYFGSNSTGGDVAVTQLGGGSPALPEAFVRRYLSVTWQAVDNPVSFDTDSDTFTVNIGSGGSAGIRLLNESGDTISGAADEDFGPGYIEHFDFYGNGNFNNLIASNQDLVGVGNDHYSYTPAIDSELFAAFNGRIYPVRLGTGLSFDTDSTGHYELGIDASSTAYDTHIILSAGDGLSGGGEFTTNQSGDTETITFRVDGDIATDSDVDSVKYSVGQLRTELNEGLGRYTYTADSELNRPRDFTDIDTTDSDLFITVLDKDSDVWSTLATNINANWNQQNDSDQIGTINMDFDYYQAENTVFGDITGIPSSFPSNALSSGSAAYNNGTLSAGQWRVGRAFGGSIGLQSLSSVSDWDFPVNTGTTRALIIRGDLSSTEMTTIRTWITNNSGEYVVGVSGTNNANWAIYEASEPDSTVVNGVAFAVGDAVMKQGTVQSGQVTWYFGVSSLGAAVEIVSRTSTTTPAHFVKRRLAVNWQDTDNPASFNDSNNTFRIYTGKGSSSSIILLDDAGNTVANAADEDFGPGYLQFFDVYGNGYFNNLIYNIQNLHGIGEQSHNYLASHHLEVPMIINNGSTSEIRPYSFDSNFSLDTENDTISLNLNDYAVDTSSAYDVVAKVDAYGKPIANGVSFSSGLPSRSVVLVGTTNWTKVFTFDSNNLPSTVDYHQGSFAGSATLNTRSARKTINFTNGLPTGTPIIT